MDESFAILVCVCGGGGGGGEEGGLSTFSSTVTQMHDLRLDQFTDYAREFLYLSLKAM